MARWYSLLLLPWMFAACSAGGLAVPDGSAGAADLGRSCASASDAASCQAIAGCSAVGCPTCDGGMSFILCVREGQPYSVDCPAPCAQPACADLSNRAVCDARSDCYALFSGDLPCKSASCTDHFVKCESGPATCIPNPSAGACALDCVAPSCRAGEVNVFPSPQQTCCSNGCVASTKCPGASSVTVACTADDQCGAHAYCQGLLKVCRSDCQLSIGTTTTGTCHRDCVGRDAHCSCVDNADCPGLFTSCDLPTGNCKSVQPPICHGLCPAGCTDATDLEYGEFCICNLCPSK